MYKDTNIQIYGCIMAVFITYISISKVSLFDILMQFWDEGSGFIEGWHSCKKG